MSGTLAINQLPAMSVRLRIPSQGAWYADVDFELDASAVVPSGKVTLAIGTTTLLGTVDPTASGRFATKARARVVGGGNGWQQPATPQHFHNDGGLTSDVVISATAAQMGETAVVSAPISLNADFVRTSAPAWQVMRGAPWYVDLNGVTQVAARPTTPAPADVTVLEFDPLLQRVEIATDTIVLPGMTLTDTRFNTLTVRDVEQTFDTFGARGVLLCGANDGPSSRLSAALATLIRMATGLPQLRAYRYRVVTQNPDGRLVLQAVTQSAGVPDQLPISVWYGAPGVSGKPKLGSICIVEFTEGDPSQPVVRAFDGSTPTEVDIAASTLVDVDAPTVGIGTKATRSGVATLETMTPLLAAVLAVVTTSNALALAVNGIVGTPNATALAAPAAVDPSGSLSTAVTTAFSAYQAAAVDLLPLLPKPNNFSSTVEIAS